MVRPYLSKLQNHGIDKRHNVILRDRDQVGFKPPKLEIKIEIIKRLAWNMLLLFFHIMHTHTK